MRTSYLTGSRRDSAGVIKKTEPKRGLTRRAARSGPRNGGTSLFANCRSLCSPRLFVLIGQVSNDLPVSIRLALKDIQSRLIGRCAFPIGRGYS